MIKWFNGYKELEPLINSGKLEATGMAVGNKEEAEKLAKQEEPTYGTLYIVRTKYEGKQTYRFYSID